MRVVPAEPTDRFVYSLEMKRNWSEHGRLRDPRGLPGPAVRRLERLGARRPTGRSGAATSPGSTFRIRDGVPYFIEANPLPGLAPGWSDLVILAEGWGSAMPT